MLAAGCHTPPRPHADLTAATDRLFAAWDTPGSPGCALGVVKDGELVYGRGYGSANLEHGIPLSTSSVFRIASVSKQFTAACVALLEQQGALSLDDSVRVYLPELPEYTEHVTLRHMLHHTSGLPEYLRLIKEAGLFTRPLDFFDEREALWTLMKTERPDFEVGDRALYSNTNYFLLSIVIKRVAGQSLRAFAEQHLFAPLGMKATHFHDDVTELVENRATGYRATDGGGFAIDETPLEIVGDGGLFTTVEDLVLWDRNYYNNQLGDGGAELIDAMQRPAILNDGTPTLYGLGLRIDEYAGATRVSHGGSWVGFRSNVMRFPDHRLTVICLCNLRQVGPKQLAEQVADLWLTGRL